MAFESLCANPFNNACSFVSPFTICDFNTVGVLKVTQIRPKNIFKKNQGHPGYLFTQPGINTKSFKIKKNKK